MLAAAGLKRLEIDAGTAIPTEIMLPAPGQAAIGMECRTNDTGTPKRAHDGEQSDHLRLRDGRAGVHAGTGRDLPSPVAAFCVLEDGDLRMRAQLFSEDGRDMVEDRAVFDCGDRKTPAELARELLANAPESIRSLFAAQ